MDYAKIDSEQPGLSRKTGNLGEEVALFVGEGGLCYLGRGRGLGTHRSLLIKAPEIDPIFLLRRAVRASSRSTLAGAG